jgi:dTDP-4-amino-4,6-dideoxygalactose transaminase
MKRIQLAKPKIGIREKTAVLRVLQSGNLAQGPEVKKFESHFSKLVEERECVAVNSGTSALHLALLSLGVGPGDEVIVPSFTFAATANSVALTGAKPVFVDIDPSTFNIDPAQITSAITARTKAIQVVHLYGLPAKMDSIQVIAKRHNLLIIEDAAQAHMAQIDGQPVGTFGDAAAFSFYPTKNMTAGEGGMVVLKESAVARLCRLYRNQGMEQKYQNEVVGFNYRMTDIHAAIGIQQLKKLGFWTEQRIQNAEYLSRQIDSSETPVTPNGYKHVFHQYTVTLTQNRDLISKYLDQKGISNGVYYPTPVHALPSFDLNLELPNTREACETALSLPIHPSLSRADLKRIARTLEEARSFHAK